MKFEMSSLQEMQQVDRELLSELIESPINPAFMHMSAPLKNGYDPMFYLQINGEALWQWRVIKRPDQMFEALQDNLYQNGYRLSSCCKSRVGLAVYSRMQYVAKKVRNTTNNKNRQAVRSNFWCTIALHPEEISQVPEETIARLKEAEEQLVSENLKLSKELEGKV